MNAQPGRRVLAEVSLSLVIPDAPGTGFTVIGPHWATTPGPAGRPCLLDPDDLVRIEVQRGLDRADVRVIPVLVDGHAYPRPMSSTRDGKTRPPQRIRTDRQGLGPRYRRPVPPDAAQALRIAGGAWSQ
jgi:hypothetical protein